MPKSAEFVPVAIQKEKTDSVIEKERSDRAESNNKTEKKAKKKSSPRTKLGEISNFVNIGDTTKPFGG